MGLSLSCLAAEAACCFTSTACRCVTKCFSLSSSVATRVAYSLLLLLNSLIAWVMLSDWALKKLQDISYGYLDINCEVGLCYGILAVYRVCFSLGLFHFAMAALLIGVNTSKDARAGLQNGYWGPKIFFWLLLIVLSFFIPNQFYMGWGYIDMVGAGLFLLVQLALLVDMAHSWSEYLIERWEESYSKKWSYTLIGSTCLMGLLSFTLTGVLYYHFCASECRLNQFFVTFNIILVVISMFLSAHPSIQEAKPQSGLFPGVLVGLYSTYLVFSAVLSEPTADGNQMCNPFANSTGSSKASIVMGALFTFSALVYSTTRLAHRGMYSSVSAGEDATLIQSEPANKSMRVQSAIESGALHPSTDVEDVDDSKYSPDDEADGCTYNYSLFHIVYAFATMYVAMLLTDWNSVGKSDDLVRVGQSWVAVWVKLVSSWLVHSLYAWTLLAPVLLPDREWD